MGLVSFLGGAARSLVGVGARLLGIGGTAAARVTGGVATRAAAFGRAGALPFAAGAAGGFVPGFFDGGDGGGGGGALAMTRGRQVVQGPQGGTFVLSRTGQPIRPSMLIPAGQPLPARVSSIVSISPDGSLIGVTLKRRKRTLGGELSRLRSAAGACRSIRKIAKSI